MIHIRMSTQKPRKGGEKKNHPCYTRRLIYLDGHERHRWHRGGQQKKDKAAKRFEPKKASDANNKAPSVPKSTKH